MWPLLFGYLVPFAGMGRRFGILSYEIGVRLELTSWVDLTTVHEFTIAVM
jgi:hypothetical protein